MIRPTGRGLAVFALGFIPALVPALVAVELWSVWITVLTGLIGILVFDALLAPSPRRIETELRVPELLYIGDPEPLELTVAVTGRPRAVRLEVLFDLDADLEPQPARLVDLPAGQRAELRLPLVPRRRGQHGVRALWMRWAGPLGLMERVVRRDCGRTVAVVPNTRAVRAAALRFFTDQNFLSGLKVEHYVGDGSEFDCLREYVPGLDHRAIHWKSSARHRTLLVREFRAERNHEIVIAFDTGHLMSQSLHGIPRLDHAINAGLFLAYCALKTGDRVSLFGFDDRVHLYTAPQGGVNAMKRLQHQSAQLGYGTGETNFTLGLTDLSVRLRRRALVVLITEFSDTVTAELMAANLERLARRHVVVFATLRDDELEEEAAREPRSALDLNRSVVAGGFLLERERVHRRLARRGIRCLDVRTTELTTELVNGYLDIKRRELV